MDLVPNSNEVVKLPIKSEGVTKAGNSTHPHQDEIKIEFSQTELDVKVKKEDIIMEKLNFQIKSEPSDTKFGILNRDDDLYVKIEPIVTEEVHLKADQHQIATDQARNVSTCEEKGIAETCGPQAITDSNTYKNRTRSVNNTSDNCCNASQTETSGIHCDKYSPKTSISKGRHAKIPKILEGAVPDGLHLHIKTRTTQKSFMCSECNYRCTQKRSLNQHLKTHSEEKPFKCSICDYRCTQRSSLTKHLRVHSGEKPVKCSICDYRCRDKGCLKEHLKTHTAEKPFQCSVCDYRCTQKANLERHLQTHTGERPFQCSVCNFRFTQKGHLEQHLKTHTGEKPFKCSVCNCRFTRKDHLEQHFKIHTGEKPFMCNVCDYRCTHKAHLEQHLKTHTGEKPFKCSVCSFRFTQKAHLKRHLKIHRDVGFQEKLAT